MTQNNHESVLLDALNSCAVILADVASGLRIITGEPERVHEYVCMTANLLDSVREKIHLSIELYNLGYQNSDNSSPSRGAGAGVGTGSNSVSLNPTKVSEADFGDKGVVGIPSHLISRIQQYQTLIESKTDFLYHLNDGLYDNPGLQQSNFIAYVDYIAELLDIDREEALILARVFLSSCHEAHKKGGNYGK